MKTLEEKLAETILKNPGVEIIFINSYDPYEKIDNRSFYKLSIPDEDAIEIYYYYEYKNIKKIIYDYNNWVDKNKHRNSFKKIHNKLVKCILIDIHREKLIDYHNQSCYRVLKK